MCLFCKSEAISYIRNTKGIVVTCNIVGEVRTFPKSGFMWHSWKRKANLVLESRVSQKLVTRYVVCANRHLDKGGNY